MNATDQPGVRPTIVLLHGAFADASSWNGVIERLQQQGSHVVMISQPQAVTDVIVTAATAVAGRR
jgi:alpha-beta hydrolase superfamily lysophospholipase